MNLSDRTSAGSTSALRRALAATGRFDPAGLIRDKSSVVTLA
jgi:hypothetical protein